MRSCSVVVVLGLSLLLSMLGGCIVEGVAVADDIHPNCSEWADAGECEKNPAYMNTNCASSCYKISLVIEKSNEELNGIESFFDLKIPDIHGNIIDFEQYRNEVTILTNVASYCGYTESHYKGLVELWSHVQDSNVNILAFPCNQFGQQEPGTATEIEKFAKSKGVQFTIMNKINVNGPDTNLVYKYLKKVTGISMITWNFATYFIVHPDGTVVAKNNVEPMDLLEYSLGLLREEL